MHLDRAVRDFEVLSDLAVGETRGDAAEHFKFALGKKLRDVRFRLLNRAGTKVLGKG